MCSLDVGIESFLDKGRCVEPIGIALSVRPIGETHWLVTCAGCPSLLAVFSPFSLVPSACPVLVMRLLVFGGVWVLLLSRESAHPTRTIRTHDHDLV